MNLSNRLKIAGNSRPEDPPNSKDRGSASPAAAIASCDQSEKNGLWLLSPEGIPTSVDLVAVHGLQGDAHKTWKAKDGTLWLRDLLPKDVPQARILTFGYDSTMAFTPSVSTMQDIARSLLNRLSGMRSNTDKKKSHKRPIVFICHSLGGIVLKKALILAHENTSNKQYQEILKNTKAIAFFGVPHQGSSIAGLGNMGAKLLKAASGGTSTNDAFVGHLKSNCRALQEITDSSVQRLKDMKIYTFYETKKFNGSVVSIFMLEIFDLLIEDFDRLSLKDLLS